MFKKQKQKKVIEDYILNNKDKFYRIAYSYVQNKEDALDVIQEAIYKALKTSNSLQEVKYIKTWFHKILIHSAIDLLRKNKKYILEGENQSILEQTYIDTYENLDLKKALDILPQQQRIIIILKYFEDLKLQEIADILDENLSTIKNRLYKALKTLKFEILAQEEIEDERKRENTAIKTRIL